MMRHMDGHTSTGDYVTSHQFVDDFALAYHRRVAEVLRSSPEEVVAFAEVRQRRRCQSEVFGPGERRAFAEWDDVLRLAPDELAARISEESERGQRLRQSSPFAGLLPEEEGSEFWRPVKREHVVSLSRLVSAISGERLPVIVGSQALYAVTGYVPARAALSEECDYLLPSAGSEGIARVRRELGILSPFQAAHDYYADALGRANVVLVPGWEDPAPGRDGDGRRALRGSPRRVRREADGGAREGLAAAARRALGGAGLDGDVDGAGGAGLAAPRARRPPRSVAALRSGAVASRRLSGPRSRAPAHSRGSVAVAGRTRGPRPGAVAPTAASRWKGLPGASPVSDRRQRPQARHDAVRAIGCSTSGNPEGGSGIPETPPGRWPVSRWILGDFGHPRPWHVRCSSRPRSFRLRLTRRRRHSEYADDQGAARVEWLLRPGR